MLLPRQCVEWQGLGKSKPLARPTVKSGEKDRKAHPGRAGENQKGILEANVGSSYASPGLIFFLVLISIIFDQPNIMLHIHLHLLSISPPGQEP